MNWTQEERIAVAARIAAVLHEEARTGRVLPRRVFEMTELIHFALTMPPAFLEANQRHFAEWTRADSAADAR